MTDGKLTPLSTRWPFIDGLRNLPDRKKEFNKLRNWVNEQPHLPSTLVSDDFIYLFLHACAYNMDKSKRCLDSYFTLRSAHPDIFANRNLNDPLFQQMIGMAQLAILPQLTPEGHRILIYRLVDPDYRKMIFEEAVRAFALINDCIVSEESLVDGYVFIFDMAGVQLGHLARVSLPPLRSFMHYVQEGHPIRIKQVHVLNTAPFVHHIVRLAKPLIKPNLWDYVKFHKGNVPEGFPLHLLPQDYGGQQEPLGAIHDRLYAKMMGEYGAWVRESDRFHVDESKRPKTLRSALFGGGGGGGVSWMNMFAGPNGPLKDEPITFKILATLD